MNDFSRNTCVKFVPRRQEQDYVYLKKIATILSRKGCHSLNWGRKDGVNLISLGPGCYNRSTIVHELNHAVGFLHEQQRLDRNKYIEIKWKEIPKTAYRAPSVAELRRQFQKVKTWENILKDKFDYNSVMLYDRRFFKVLQPGAVIPKHKSGLSRVDIRRINLLYNCTA
ncbi:hypothetical protein LAZ67_6000106 [Cordylochernes scorpioides]|nr:hypothetical protein LAZ67_6000106 [Cordylochernes scorpioides]